MISVEPAHASTARLGETPLWDAGAELLRWIDIEEPCLYAFDPVTGRTEAHPQEGTYLGSMALTRSGRILLARDLSLKSCLPDGTDARPLGPVPAETMPDTRLNDGRVDPMGRLWIGTMDNDLHRGLGSLYRVDAMGEFSRIFGDVIVSNGIAFAPGGDAMWFTDTRRHVTWKITLEADGTPRSREIWADYTTTGDRPDGACVDADGCLWQAVFAGGRVIRYAPDGRVDLEIPLPVTNPTCLCFGGADLKTLFVTTATKFLTPDALEKEPLAGSVLAITGAGEGVPECLFDD